MIRILRNDRELELSPDTSIQLEWNTWLFSDDDKLPGSFSYQIRFGLTPSNLIFIDYAHRPEQVYNELQVIAYLSNVLAVRCTLAYDVEGNMAVGHLKFEAAEVNRKIKNTKLRDAIKTDFTVGPNLLLSLYLRQIAQHPIGTYPVVFAPIYNPDFIESDFAFNDEETKGDAPFELYNFRYEPYINPYGKTGTGRGFLYDESISSSSFLPYTNVTVKHMGRFLVPFPYLVPVIRELMQWLGFDIAGNWIDDPDIKCRVIYNTYALGSRLFNVFGILRIKIAEHLPDMTVGEFLKAIRKYFVLSFEFRNPPGIVEIKSLAQILDSQEIEDWSNYQSLENPRLRRPENRGFSVKVAEDSGDKLYKESNFNPTFTLGDGEQNYDVPIGTLNMYKATNPHTGAKWIIPRALQRGNVRDAKLSRSAAYSPQLPLSNEPKLRLLAYRGMQPDSSGQLYPMLTSGMYNALNKQIAQSCEDSRQRLSVFQQHIRRYLNIIDTNREMEHEFLIPESLLQKFSFNRLLGLTGNNRVYMRHLVSKLVIELPSKSGFVKAKTYSYPLLPGKFGPIDAQSFPWLEVIEINRRGQDTGPSQNAGFIADIQINCWTSPEKIAQANVSGLTVFFEIQTRTTVSATNETTVETKEYSAVISGTSAVIRTNLIVMEFPSTGYIYRGLVILENPEYLIIF